MAGGRSGSDARPRLSLIVDLNLPPTLIELLAARGMTAKHWSTLGSHTALDEVILAHTRAARAVLVTHDLDFSAILAASGDRSPSVIQIRLHDLTAEAVAVTIERVLVEHGHTLSAGALVSVSEAGARVRVLPTLNVEV